MIDLLDLVRSIAAAAERAAENKNYPVPCGQSSALLDIVRQACVERGYTAGGLAVAGVTIAAQLVEADERQAFEKLAKRHDWDLTQAHGDGDTRWLSPMTRDLYLAFLEGRAALAAAPVWAQPVAVVYPPDGTVSPFTVINLGRGLVKIGDSLHDGRLPALWFGKDGLGMGAVEEMNRAAAEGETLAVVTFSNVEGVDVLAEVVQRIRSIAFPAAPAAQGDTITLTRDELVNHRNQAFEQGVNEGKDQAAQGGAKDVTTIATKIVLDVAELDRDSPTDQPDMMLVTGEELRTIAIAAITTDAAS